MNCYEKYYRRSYNAINKLMFACKQSDHKTFANNIIKNYMDDDYQQMELEERASIINTIMIALMGLNKESIENNGKINNYEKPSRSVDIRNMDLSLKRKEILKQFGSDRVVSTDFDNWLSIFVNVPSDKTKVEHLKRVRNALLHSNFYVDYEDPVLNIIHLKTKNYYMADLLGIEFYSFIMGCYGTIDYSKIAENIRLFCFDKRIKKMNNRNMLHNVLKKLFIWTMDYEKVLSWTVDTPEVSLLKSTDKDWNVNFEEFIKKMREDKNFANMYLKKDILPDKKIEMIISLIEKKFDSSFYKMNESDKRQIIISYIELINEPKKGITEWLFYFWLLYLNPYVIDNNIKEQISSKYIFEQEPCYFTILILKCYLMIYRLQNENFVEIDYSKLNIDFFDSDIVFLSECLEKRERYNNYFLDSFYKDEIKLADNNYFLQSFQKEKTKKVLNDDKQIWNKIICDVLRNSLAHGNVCPVVDADVGKKFIEFRDINKKTNLIRTIRISVEKLEKILDSEALKPKYCNLKENDDFVLKKVKK